MFGLIRFFTPIIGAERSHDWTLRLLRLIGSIPGSKFLMRKLYSVEHPLLEREVFGLKFRNPVGLAAGFDRNGEIFREMSALGFGFVEIGTVAPMPQTGNPKPRVFRLEKEGAIVNRIGMPSKGFEKVVANVRRSHEGVIIGCNIGKNSITQPSEAPQDYLRVFRNLYQYINYFTVNVSYNTTFKHYIPHTREAIISILQPLFEFRRGQTQYRPILLKISPDLSNEDIDLMTDIMVETPLDGIVATNATVSRSNLKGGSESLKGIGSGAISGSPLTRRSIEIVRRIHKRSKGTYPIIGVGGLMSEDDVAAMLEAGATLVQVYTGYVYNGVNFPSKICRRLIADAEKSK